MWLIWAFVGLCMAGVFVYTQLPKNWRIHKVSGALILLIWLMGLAAIFLMMFRFPVIQDGGFKSAVLFIETVMFMVFCMMAIFCGIRLAVYLFCKWKKPERVEKMRCRQPAFTVVCIVISLSIGIFGWFNIDNIRSTSFDIDLTGGKTAHGTLKAAVIGDTHVGAGATHVVMDAMAANINAMDADVLLFVGDASDSCSSVDDMAYLAESLKKINPRYGKYYVSGNHDGDSEQDVRPYLEKGGMILLEDTACALPNGVILAGHSNLSSKTLKEILDKEGIREEQTVITLQHRPQNLAEIQNDCDLVVSGHTHGPRFPWTVIMQYVNFDNPEGVRQFGEMMSFTTTGVSAWGFHLKCPSHSETALLKITF